MEETLERFNHECHALLAESSKKARMAKEQRGRLTDRLTVTVELSFQRLDQLA